MKHVLGWIQNCFARLLHRSRFAAKTQLDDELQFHLHQSIQVNLAAGMSEIEARRQALIEFGGVERTREDTWRQRPGWLLETALQDARYALRGFRRNPAFTITVLATLALGIGATTAVFSIVDRILFRSLPYADADRLVSVGLTAPIIPEEFMLGGSYYVWQDNQQSFESFTSETGFQSCDLTERNPLRLNCASVEASFLSTLGVHPILGRNFLPAEDRPNGPKAALLSYSLWHNRYGADPSILNKLIDIDGVETRIIGVLPANFEMPALEPADIVLPQALNEAEERKADPGRVMYAFARLKPGVSVEQAAAGLQPLFQYSLRLAPPAFRKEVHLRVRSLRDRQMQNVRLTAWILLGAVVAVLLIVCANVAGLMLARGAARERELAVRSALGASRRRLVRQAFLESLLLSLAGAAAGWLLAELLLHSFVAIAPTAMTFLGRAKLDLRIATATLVLASLCAIGLGALTGMRRPSALSLTMRNANSSAHALLRRLMVVAQIAVSMILLSTSMLLVRSFWNLQNQNLGMTTHGVLTASIELERQQYETGQKQMQFFLQAESALRRLPGVTAVGISDTLPPAGGHHESILNVMQIFGQPRSTAGTGGMVAWRWVTPDYFRALNISFAAGRNFIEADRTSSEPQMIVSKLLAERLFPGGNPTSQALGKRVRPSPADAWYTIVGVVGDVRNSGLAHDDEPEYYRLTRNTTDDWRRSGVFILSTSLPPDSVTPWVRSEFARIDPVVPVEIQTMRERVGRLADGQRFEAVLLSFFALTGLAMAIVGLYGLTAYLTAQRTQEIGIRMALGAGRSSILRMIAWQGARLILIGCFIGTAAAIAATQTLKGLLYGVTPRDPLSLIVAVLVLAGTALAATLLPARRAVRIDPVEALRCE